MTASARSEWHWRGTMAFTGTLLYWPLFRPDWRNPFLMLYDVPTLLIAWSFAGKLLWRLSLGDGIRILRPIVALLLAVVFAAGAQFAHWPVSGHLAVATTVAILEVDEVRNPRWLRWTVLAPIVVLILIRTFWPQMPQMDNIGNTVRALFVGCLLARFIGL